MNTSGQKRGIVDAIRNAFQGPGGSRSSRNLGSQQLGGHFAPGGLLVLAIFATTYVALQIPGIGEFVVNHLMLRPTQALGVKPYQLLTAPLLMSSFLGLLFVGMLLWSIGSTLEHSLGTRRFLVWLAVASVCASAAAALCGRLLPAWAGVAIPLDAGAVFVVLLVAFAQQFGHLQVTMWGIGEPMSAKKVSYFFVALGLFSDVLRLQWPHLAAGLGALLCVVVLGRGGGSSLQGWWRKQKSKKQRAHGFGVIDGGRRGFRDTGDTGNQGNKDRWLN
ncbi:MAG TPA: hypothetical protein PLA87_18210 [Pseudomonadota bacterium]|nr:hypothetical protein [Pseudomonadota bacterium]